MLKNYLLVFFISMVPIIELRGAIPIGLGMGLPVLPTYLVCVIGNMIPVPFIYLFARKFLIPMKSSSSRSPAVFCASKYCGRFRVSSVSSSAWSANNSSNVVVGSSGRASICVAAGLQ